jgi:hypothetical protein
MNLFCIDKDDRSSADLSQKILVMKTNIKKMMLFGLMAATVMLFSFISPRGGESFEIYLNGKMIVQQAVYSDKSVRSVQLTSTSPNDKLEVYYNHCGQTGKNRAISIKDENGKILKIWKFADASGRSAMTIVLKDIYGVEKPGQNKFSIFYSSKELPDGRSLAMVSLDNSNVVRK